MKPTNTQCDTLDAMIQFSGIFSGEFGNKTIQELKEEVGRIKYYKANGVTASFQQNIKKINDVDKLIIEDFNDTLMDGLD